MDLYDLSFPAITNETAISKEHLMELLTAIEDGANGHPLPNSPRIRLKSSSIAPHPSTHSVLSREPSEVRKDGIIV